MWLQIQALPFCHQCFHQAEAPCGVTSPHGLHRWDFVGKDVLAVINNSFLENEKMYFFSQIDILQKG